VSGCAAGDATRLTSIARGRQQLEDLLVIEVLERVDVVE
jgi:hypothetical protein